MYLFLNKYDHINFQDCTLYCAIIALTFQASSAAMLILYMKGSQNGKMGTSPMEFSTRLTKIMGEDE
jgi:hypothetical protein